MRVAERLSAEWPEGLRRVLSYVQNLVHRQAQPLLSQSDDEHFAIIANLSAQHQGCDVQNGQDCTAQVDATQYVCWAAGDRRACAQM